MGFDKNICKSSANVYMPGSSSTVNDGVKYASHPYLRVVMILLKVFTEISFLQLCITLRA